ncbi:MAG: hypothetical protein M1813_002585 [Trichoglossum hirsutum]|nr:MAG: hypothetical protein M1813_002585 [Trichoglossum hirsutum]
MGAIRIISVEKVIFGVQGGFKQISPQTAVTNPREKYGAADIHITPAKDVFGVRNGEPSVTPPTVEDNGISDAPIALGEQAFSVIPQVVTVCRVEGDSTILVSGTCSAKAASSFIVDITVAGSNDAKSLTRDLADESPPPAIL